MGLVAALFCAISLVVGYALPRAAGVPAAVYSVFMFFLAAGWGAIVSRRVAASETTATT